MKRKNRTNRSKSSGESRAETILEKNQSNELEEKKTTKRAVKAVATMENDEKSNDTESKESGPRVETSRKRQRTSKGEAKTRSKKIKHLFEAPLTPVAFKKQGLVLTIGEGDVGQLGLGPDIMERGKPSKPELPMNIVQISAGGMHSLCLSKDGKVYSFGCNDEATLGRTTKDEEACSIPGKVEGIHSKVVQISAGDSHSVALDGNGRVYIWGTFRDTNGVIGMNNEQYGEMEKDGRRKRKRLSLKGSKSEKIEKLTQILTNEKITKVVSGSAHVLCLSNHGEVFSLGACDFGQLGRLAECFSVRGGRMGLNKILTAEPVKFPKRKIKCVDIWAGGYVSYAKMQDGQIYSWGLNNYFQLGFSEPQNHFMPQRSPAFDPNIDWKEISCAEHHTLALEASGVVYAMGRSDYGRLGLGRHQKDHAQELMLIEALKEHKVVSIGCGLSVSFAVDNQGVIHSWGMGSTKQLGNGDDEDDVFEPQPIRGKQIDGTKGIMATAGGQHTLLLVEKKQSEMEMKKEDKKGDRKGNKDEQKEEVIEIAEEMEGAEEMKDNEK